MTRVSKKISVGAAIMLMAMASAISVTVTLIFSMNYFNKSLGGVQSSDVLFNKISEVDKIVGDNYIGKIDKGTLNDDIIRGYIEGLGDKHANYFDAKTYQQVDLSFQGKGIGIGVTVGQNADGNIRVISVADGSPASAAKVLPDDLITVVGGEKVTDIGYDKAVSMLKGDVGTTAAFTVLRGNKAIPFSIIRKKYDTQTVDWHMIDHLGYIKITEFDSNTSSQFAKAIAGVQAKGAKGIVFDLRDNPGGELDSVEGILDSLLPKGPIVSATYKNGKTKVLKYSDDRQLDLPMAVVTNGNTASAAELFTCALKDYKKAESVGEKTYGKGTMQQIFNLSDGSAISISIAKFNPPYSANFNGKGVSPDIPVTLDSASASHLYDLGYDQDTQLQAAVQYLNTKIG